MAGFAESLGKQEANSSVARTPSYSSYQPTRGFFTGVTPQRAVIEPGRKAKKPPKTSTKEQQALAEATPDEPRSIWPRMSIIRPLEADQDWVDYMARVERSSKEAGVAIPIGSLCIVNFGPDHLEDVFNRRYTNIVKDNDVDGAHDVVESVAARFGEFVRASLDEYRWARRGEDGADPTLRARIEDPLSAVATQPILPPEMNGIWQPSKFQMGGIDAYGLRQVGVFLGRARRTIYEERRLIDGQFFGTILGTELRGVVKEVPNVAILTADHPIETMADIPVPEPPKFAMFGEPQLYISSQ